MNDLETRMVEILKDLKMNHYVVGVKAEFGTEGTRTEEALRLKEIVTKSGLELTIKIGGCEALKDIYEAKLIGVNTIVAPMIESPYAAKKYIQTVKTAFADEERQNIKFFINIETKYGMQYLEEILSTDFAKDINGIVFGRTDMTGSLGMTNDKVDSEILFNIAEDAAILTKKYNKELIIGGTVTPASIPFFKRLPFNNISGYETRKIIFDKEALNHDNAETGIVKAFEFEKLWIKNKQNYYHEISHENDKRMEILENRAKLNIMP